MDFSRCVERGAMLLDEEMPGWEEKINLSTLELMNEYRCIVWQLYGSFSDVAPVLVGDRYAHEYGFAIGRFATKKDWRALTEEWRILIQARRNVNELEKNLALEKEKICTT